VIPAASHAWRATAPTRLTRGHPAVRLLATLLMIVTVVVVPAGWLPLPALLVVLGLQLAGFCWRRLPALVAPWASVALLVLLVHTLTTTAAAPLWHPSLLGLQRGLVVLARLATMLAAVASAGRALPVRDLTVAARWCLRPLRLVGVDTRHLGLTLAVALGTAPRTQAEAVRLQACLRLRRPVARRRTPWRVFGERLQVVPPLMDGLARRAETLPLMLAHRVPADAEPVTRPPWWQLAPLVAWCAALIWYC